MLCPYRAQKNLFFYNYFRNFFNILLSNMLNGYHIENHPFKEDSMDKIFRALMLKVLVLVVIFGFIATGHAEEVNSGREAVIKGDNEFGLALYNQLKAEKGNLFISPYSISTALAMTYAGARGNTAKQMAEVLHFNSEQEKLPVIFAEMIKDMNARGTQGNYQLSVANALWGQKGYKFLKEFIDLVNNNYGAGLNEVDFKNATEEARKTINTWVEEKTNGKIKDLIPKGILNNLTRLVLTNAIYFKGNWAAKFKKEDTKDMPFNIIADKQVSVPMMYQKLYAKIGWDGNIQIKILELPYVGEELSMLILLPLRIDGLTELENSLIMDKINNWTVGRKEEVEVYLPKFKMTYKCLLANTLKSMGIIDAFTPPPPLPEISGADFSGITGNKDLYISQVIHKTFVDVNEEGTEAAAATAVITESAGYITHEPLIFKADHPFLFLIRENKTGSILFIGRIVNPNE